MAKGCVVRSGISQPKTHPHPCLPIRLLSFVQPKEIKEDKTTCLSSPL